MMRQLFSFLNLIIFATLMLFAPALWAGEVTKVKGTHALVDFKGENTPNVGDSYYTLTGGKKVGIIQITKIKGDKGIAKIVKGTVQPGQTLLAKAQGKGKHSSDTPSGRAYFGAMLGVSEDSMNVQVNSYFTGLPLQSVSVSGNSFSLMGLLDYQILPQFWFRGLAGIEGFSVTGSNTCGTGNTQACTASIYYLSLDFMARYVFSEGMYRPWLGAGLGLMFPVSKSATALSTSSIASTNVIQIAGGLDWFVTPKFYVPISIEYGLLPKSNDVSASWIELRLGVGVPF